MTGSSSVTIFWILMAFHAANCMTFPKQGLSVETRGQVLYTRKLISIPAVVSMGDIRSMLTLTGHDHCRQNYTSLVTRLESAVRNATRSNLGEIFNLGYEAHLEHHVCKTFEELCGHTSSITSSPRRHKRFLFGLGTAVGAGVGAFGYWLYNKVAGADAADAIERLKHSQSELKKLLRAQTQNSYIMAGAIQKVWSHFMTLRKDMEILKQAISCNTLNIREVFTYSTIISILPNQFHRAVNNLLQSEVSPDLLSYDQAKQLVNSHWMLKDSLYSMDTTLLYQLSHAIPVMVDPDTLSIYYMLQIPHLPVDSVGVLYETYNFGSYSDQAVAQIDIPRYVGKFRMGLGNATYHPVMDQLCHKTPGVWVCGQDAVDLTENNQCVQQLFKNHNLSSCQYRVKKHSVDINMLVTSEILFYYTKEKKALTLELAKWGEKKPTTIDVLGETVALPLSNFTEFILDAHHVYGAPLQPYPVVINVPQILIPDLDSPVMNTYAEDWKSLEEVTRMINNTLDRQSLINKLGTELKEPVRWISGVSISASVVVLIFVCLGCGLWCIKRKRSKHGSLKNRLDALSLQYAQTAMHSPSTR